MVTADRTSPGLQTVESAAAAAYEVDPLCDLRWADLVSSHPQASVFHSPNWLRALRNVYGYEPVVITTSPPRATLTNGLVLCRIKSWLTGRRLVSLPFSDHCEPLTHSREEFDIVLAELKRRVKAGEWKYVEIRPISCEPSFDSELARFGTYHLHSLDLSVTEERLFRNFHRDCIQRKIRRAEREKLQYEDGASESLLKKFYRLAVMTRRRQGLPPQPLKWFRGLIASFGQDLKIRVVSKDGLPLASILTLLHKKSMVYKYGCSDEAFNNLGGTALLFWKTMQEAKANGLEELDMGRSDIDSPGLVAFKEHLGASGRQINYWTYPQGPGGLPSVWKKRLTGHIVSIMPDLALEMIGNVMYKHVG
jgi:lipid II:glycine glycyltransferase (peptidoglycan interpeptide bridge formation enzyme)